MPTTWSTRPTSINRSSVQDGEAASSLYRCKFGADRKPFFLSSLQPKGRLWIVAPAESKQTSDEEPDRTYPANHQVIRLYAEQE